MKRRLAILIPLATLVIGFFLGIWWDRETAKSRGLYCNNILRQIDSAKEEAAQQLRLARGAQISVEQITPFLKGHRLPRCPSGGEYTLNPVGEMPTCSLGRQSPPYWHKLTE